MVSISFLHEKNLIMNINLIVKLNRIILNFHIFYLLKKLKFSA